MSDTVEENEDDIVEVNDNLEDLSGHPATTTDVGSTDSVLNVDTTGQVANHDATEEEQAEPEEPEET
ncbi:MAG TPA: hypothetical protein VE643_07965, partial [Nitrososphaeraceae archaeon]|nr:hypothetical protein [Nitrososphaeraceae archaeon]